MKIVVLDGYALNPGDLSWKGMEDFGDLTVYDRSSYDPKDEDIILERAKDADIILTNKTPLTKNVINNMPNLKYIGVLATGYDVVDIDAAKAFVRFEVSQGTEETDAKTIVLSKLQKSGVEISKEAEMYLLKN